MADTYSTNFDFVLIDIGGSEDTWGDKLVANWESADTEIKAAQDAAATADAKAVTADGKAVSAQNDVDALAGSLGSMATRDAGTGGSQHRTNSQLDGRFARRAANLGDLSSASSARSNLQLGSMATRNAGTGDGQHRTNGQNDDRFASKEVSADEALGGDFDSNARILCTRVGQTVTITAYSVGTSAFIGLNSSQSQPSASSGVVPAQFRPANGNYASLRDSISGRRINARVFSNGDLNVSIWWLDGSTSSAATTTINTFSITYNITPS